MIYIAIALISGFAMGCGCTVTLLFCLKRVAATVGIIAKEPKPLPLPENEESAPTESLPIDKQWDNLWAYDGKPQKQEVSEQNGS